MTRKAPAIAAEVELGSFGYTPPKYGKEGERKAHASVSLKLAHQSSRPQQFFDGLARIAGSLCTVKLESPGGDSWKGVGRFGSAAFDQAKDAGPAVLRVPLIVAGETAEELMPLLHFRLELDDAEDATAQLDAQLFQPSLGG